MKGFSLSKTNKKKEVSTRYEFEYTLKPKMILPTLIK